MHDYNFRRGVKYKTVDGQEARIMAQVSNEFPLLVLVKTLEHGDIPHLYTKDGKHSKYSELDLVVPIQKRRGWINIFFDGKVSEIFETEELAKQSVDFYDVMDRIEIEYNQVREEEDKNYRGLY